MGLKRKRGIKESRRLKKTKFNNKVVRDKDGNIIAHSKAELVRYKELHLLQENGIIEDLKTQVSFRLEINNVLICRYVADFTYYRDDEYIVEDKKGYATPVYKLKKKMMLAIHNIEILET